MILFFILLIAFCCEIIIYILEKLQQKIQCILHHDVDVTEYL